MMDCICIDPAHVEKVWPLVSLFIEEAAHKGGGDFDLIQGDVLKGEKLLWVAAEGNLIFAAAVTGLHIGVDKQRFCCIWACGGKEKARWITLKEELERFAKAEGCETICLYGRKGWAREFPDYRLVQIKLEKRL